MACIVTKLATPTISSQGIHVKIFAKTCYWATIYRTTNGQIGFEQKIHRQWQVYRSLESMPMSIGIAVKKVSGKKCVVAQSICFRGQGR